MKRALRDQWTAALRSGDYRQGYGKLCSETFIGNDKLPTPTFCCLGVLCNILDPNAWDQESWRSPIEHDDDECLSYLDTELDDDMLKRIGLSVEDQKDLVTLNDDERASFTRIADAIDANVKVED